MADHGGTSPRKQSVESKAFPVGAAFQAAPILVEERKIIGGRTTFDSDSLGEFHKPIDTYEGIHRYDPDFEWTPAEEKKLVRKVGRLLIFTIDRRY